MYVIDSSFKPVISSLTDRIKSEIESDDINVDFYYTDPTTRQLLSELEFLCARLKHEFHNMHRGEANNTAISEVSAKLATKCVKVHQLYGDFHFGRTEEAVNESSI
jgi:hypothetical protein